MTTVRLDLATVRLGFATVRLGFATVRLGFDGEAGFTIVRSGFSLFTIWKYREQSFLWESGE